ncbi:DUF6776 family protein [Microbulbifer thermotolerans]|uniref:Uncharacterized protein n=1 Tax=Microbulbifer thermotolerans TaxID=252514 RepID=A0A143HIL8_MICTH|nr:DUF6776 family protein [Microbulbifer thermotolerans]AMX01559.1 hypothetical protein A3224_02250 [Microbulbifer thermotolerans]MCX2778414.1 hypothetical protein [Microbulbifer thermotolerans]MCX2784168.1 hypothetical protein [Microbulbifer thermotolerans]MCX2796183.1 hypothetical protein [Microbulbifer thermotolerans]MCX2803285.1 hypothetical protein [Microbulbifer thermotolerans]
MARKVKGSKQYRMKVVPDRPMSRAFSTVGVALLVLATSTSAYFAGQHHLRSSLDQKTVAHEQALHQLEALKSENEALRLRAVTAERSLAIGEKASEKVRAELVQKESRIAELKQEISFYRGLMAPADGSEGVSIGRFSISQTADERRYQYKLLVQQSATRHQLVTGRAIFTVVGRQDGQPKRYSLSELSPQVDSESIPLRFKYFQNIEGELRLPQGFQPEEVELSLKSSGRKGFNIEQRYGWLVQKN